MKIVNTIIFSVGVASFLIAIHQSMKHGFYAAYWLYMISIGLLLWYKIRKDAAKKESKKS